MSTELQKYNIPLERDLFLRDLIRHLSGVLQDIVGIDEASGFISIVGQKMGDDINQLYRDALKVDSLNRHQVSSVLVDLKKRIQGDFIIVSEDENKIVLKASTCPFAEKVIGRPSLCMMTSNVFGTITAENLGYAKVSLEETIAKGDDGCKIVIYLNESDESKTIETNEYFKG